ncbi:hypothetical protein [Marinobacter sp.]|uniref:hypothetical protein n=1 Tax=Marinobacter sp. TaxID=50741 RepID=UPI00384D9B22
MTFLTRAGLITAITLLMGGCGSSSSSSSDSGSSGGSGGDETVDLTTQLQFFRGSLSAIDPAAPKNVFLVDDEKDPTATSIPILAGKWGGTSVNSLHVGQILYPRSDGTLWRVAVESDTDGNPQAPVRVSSETDAASICRISTPFDFADTLQTPVAYEIDSDGNCNDEQNRAWYTITLGDDKTQARQPFPGRPIASLHTRDDGSHDGWLVLNGTSLDLILTDGSATVSVSGNETVNYAEFLGALSDGSQILNVNGNLRRYDPSTSLLYQSMHDFGGTGGSVNDTTLAAISGDNEFYFVDQGVLYRTDVANNSVQKLDEPGNVGGVFCGIEEGQLWTGPMLLTEKYIVWSYQRSTGECVVRRVGRLVGQNEGNADNLFSETEDDAVLGGRLEFSTIYPLRMSTPNWVFYERNFEGVSEAIAQPVDSLSSSDVVIEPDADWVGASFGRDGGPTLGAMGLSHMFLTRNTASGPELRVARSSVGFDKESLLLGDMPDDFGAIRFALGFGSQRLGTLGTATGNADVFSVNAEAEGSFKRITNTADKNETPFPFF